MSSQMLAAHAKVQKAFKEQTDNVNKEEKELLLAVRLGPKAAILSAACLFLASISSVGPGSQSIHLFFSGEQDGGAHP